VRQDLAPHEPTVRSDQRRVESWVANAMETHLRFHGLGTKRTLVVMMYGETYADVLMDRKAVKDILDSEPARCEMDESQFAPEPVERREDRLWMALKAGRFSASDPAFGMQMYLQTHREFEAGQREKYMEAMNICRLTLEGKRPHIGPYQPHDWIQHTAKYFLSTAISRRYTADQIAELQRLVGQSKDAQMIEAQEDAPRRELMSGGPAGSPAAPSAAPEPASLPGAPQPVTAPGQSGSLAGAAA
jgi:hypothetical protein